ncbi:polymorphic toxin-type HINT domain-containing protein [Streptomyces sp. NBC_01565]|uniref:polymorphic toxin-type HINT domain-containing protein n=1 Tax=unclassified Streptomyces TaxID=2593676 RepID=UPI00225B905C|nr:polymorphic toxin-type HINT domain-containing protein [Streptomyces sp. NBC_01565]MCX4546353.1 polymorphic toxin-type HINT domain-containing protein [Streptomyces sp. NBC_01565]
MYHHIKQKIVTLLTVLCLTVGAGVGSAAAAGPPEREPTLLEIIARVEQYSKCRELPLLQRPACRKEFALKSAKLGLAVGAYLYVFQSVMKDDGASFAEVSKELGVLGGQLKPLLHEANQEANPERRRAIFKQFVTTYKAAQPHVDKLRTNLVKASRLLGAENESAELLTVLTVILGDYFPESKPIEPTPNVPTWDIWADLKDMGKALDQINAGFDQMNSALDDMNATMVEVNDSIDGINKGLAQANRGMDKLNEGVGQMNDALGKTNTAVKGMNKAAERIREVPEFNFDFSHVAENVGANQVSKEELAAQDRRMGLVLDLLPGIGDGKGVIDALKGKDIATGERLSPVDRAMGAVVVLRWLRVGGKLDPDDIRKAQRRTKCDSFPAGTRVLMADGSTRPIEAVRTGDTVLATDPASGTTGGRRVDDTIHTPDDREFTGITLDASVGGGSLTATDHHPFWTQNREQWTLAADLNAGDTLRTPDGGTAQIQKVTHWKDLQPAYNLTVNELHTYYVLAGVTPVLVHNASCDFIPGEIPEAKDIDRGSLVKLKEKQLEKALKSLGEDPHGFKADWVGKNMVSRFDAMRDGDSRIILVSKDGRILVPTNYRYRP